LNMQSKILLCAAALLTHPAAAQEHRVPSDGETVARVEPLDRFHEVIFPMWHDAWPNRNIDKLRALLPDVKEGIAAIAAAELPGILREKKSGWERGVADLKAAGEEYARAAAGNDPQPLLAAAEKLHARYEALTRVLRPALKELEDFHRTLYVLYHYELPAGAIDRIRLSVDTLKVKLEALNKAVIPGRLKDRTEAFVAARASLGVSLAELDALLGQGDHGAIKSAVVAMHAKYEALSAVFD
jgi:hypothetical protein